MLELRVEMNNRHAHGGLDAIVGLELVLLLVLLVCLEGINLNRRLGRDDLDGVVKRLEQATHEVWEVGFFQISTIGKPNHH